MENIEQDKVQEPAGVAANEQPSAVPAVPLAKPAAPQLTIDDFKKIELKVAQIKEVIDHPNADKLYVLTIDIGEKTKQVVAGIKRGYTKEELVGKYVVVVNNLQPAMLRGVESQGMILAASDDNCIAVLSPDKVVKPGAAVK